MSRQIVFAATTFAFAMILAAALVLAPDISARTLLYAYAGLLLTSLFARRFAWRNSLVIGLDAFLSRLPYAPFIIAALFLLTITPFLMLANQMAIAGRFANWAYGFLVLGIGWATLCIVALPTRIREALDHWADVLLVSFVVALFIAGYFLIEGVSPSAERAFIVDMYPKNIADRATRDDLLVSDSPDLRLSAIPRLAAHLDVNPDARGAALWDDLMRALQGKSRVFWVSTPKHSLDTQGYLAAFLKANGCLGEVTEGDLTLRVYEVRTPLIYPNVLPLALAARHPDTFAPTQVDWGVLKLIGARFETRVCSHDALAVAMRWQMPQPRDDLKLSLMLVDAKGRRIQAQDFPIEPAQSLGYFSLVVPFGTPPGVYRLQAAVYSTSDQQRLRVQNVATYPDHITLGSVQVERSNDLSADPLQTRQEASLASARVPLCADVMLDAYDVSPHTIIPGESVSVIARWRALQDHLPDYAVRIRIARGEQTLAQASGAPVDGAYPTSSWRAGEAVTDRWDIRVPPDTAEGSARLEVGIAGGKSLYVADVNILPITRTFQVPAKMQSAHAMFTSIGELIGYDVDRTTLAADETLQVTLYWRGVSMLDQDYRVFTQLLAEDDHLIAQSDSAPDDGKRPTRSWISGEIVVDHHTLHMTDTAYRGSALLIVGMYDPETLERVPLQGDESFFALPAHIQVNAP